MSTIKSKVSIQVAGQQPDFVQSDHPDFLAFLKAYYEFLESAELQLTTLGSVDSLSLEASAGSNSLLLQENLNRYRTGEKDTVLLEDTTFGAFINGEIITGQTSKATAVIRVQDININSRLFISSQNNFIIGEQVIGAETNASGVISGYTANPVQNITQLMEYYDVDDTIDTFFTEFKEAYMRTIPKALASGLDERNLLKNIKDLYRAKGTRGGHELFFRMLLDEDAIITYPTKDIMRLSDGTWTDDTILRSYALDSTIIMEDSSAANGFIYILMEDGSQIMMEDNVNSTDALTGLVGETITQAAVTDLSILVGGAYYNQGFEVISEATAIVDSIFRYNLSGITVTEFVLNPGSIDGTFVAGHRISGPDSTTGVTLTGKIGSILDKTVITLSDFSSSQYFKTTDTLTVSADVGVDGVATIDSVSSGTISNIIVDNGGSDYEIGENVVVDNTNTNGAELAGEISLVNGGFAPETGTLTDNFRITLESGTPGGPGEILLEESIITYELPTGTFNIGETITGITSEATGTVVSIELDITTIMYVPLTGTFTLGERIVGSVTGFKSTVVTNTINNFIANQEDLGMVAADRFILESETTIDSSYLGRSIAQERATGIGDITDVRVIKEGWGYTALPTLTITTAAGTNGTIRAKGTNVGKISAVNIVDQGIHYTDAPSTKIVASTNYLCTEISGIFLVNETITGATSGATGKFKIQYDATGIIELNSVSTTPFIAGETITGGGSGQTAKIDSFTSTSIPVSIGTVVNRTGKYLTETGWLDSASSKMIDSYYYQDYSYVVKTASSIVDWREELLAAVHPAGWAVFGEVDIGGNAPALGYLANITSVTGLGALYSQVWNALIGRRLGTTTQGPINPTPMAEANEPDDKANLYNPALKVSPGGGAFTLYETITGATSGATAKVVLDSTTDEGVRIITFEQGYNQGIFQINDVITGSSSGRSTTVQEVYGLRGKRDVTLRQILETRFQTGPKGNNAVLPPNLGTLNEFMFAPSIVASDASSLTFRSHNVYVTGIPFSTLSSGIDTSVTTIPVASDTSYPTAGTIEIDNELIDYTGKAGNTLTGCTRGQHSTVAAAHLTGAVVDAVRWGIKQDETRPGYKISDWLTDYQGTTLTIGDITNYPNRKNDISPPLQVTIYKT